MPAQNNNMQENIIGVCGSDFSNQWVVPRTVGGVWCSVASPPRPTVEFVLVRALAHERRRAGEGPSFGGRDEGHHDVGPPSSSAAAAASAASAASAAAAASA